MKLKGIWMLCAIALGGLALAVAGCGGGGTTTVTVSTSETTEESMTESTETMTESTETMTETTETETTETTETETTETESGTDTNALGFLTSEKCQEYLDFVSSFGSAMSGAGGTDLEQAAQAMQDSADQAPEEIREDFQTFAEFYVKLAAAYEGVDMTSGSVSPEVLARLQNLSNEVDMAKVTTASTNISTWLTQNCTGTG